jgi:hypothetical protein
MFRRIFLLAACCVMFLFQHSWACGPQPQPRDEGLFDVVVDIVTAPCRLLTECFSVTGNSTPPRGNAQPCYREQCVYHCVPICYPRQSTVRTLPKCKTSMPDWRQPKMNTVKKTVPAQSVQIETTPKGPAVTASTSSPKTQGQPSTSSTPAMQPEPHPQAPKEITEPARDHEPSLPAEPKRMVLPEFPAIPSPRSQPLPTRKPQEETTLDTLKKPLPTEKLVGPPPQNIPPETKADKPSQEMKELQPEPAPRAKPEVKGKTDQPATPVPKRKEERTRSNSCAPVPWCYPPPVCR